MILELFIGHKFILIHLTKSFNINKRITFKNFLDTIPLNKIIRKWMNSNWIQVKFPWSLMNCITNILKYSILLYFQIFKIEFFVYLFFSTLFYCFIFKFCFYLFISHFFQFLDNSLFLFIYFILFFLILF